MRHILSLFLLTVMLRVWWGDHSWGGYEWKAGEGILIGCCDDGLATVRKDNGEMTIVKRNQFTKTKWVDVKADKS